MNIKFKKTKKAFTLIELLIVIAIIGILFIVLVSKVDFATDKAKATGVQTMFRSYQMAFDQVARENAGFTTFGFDTGDNAGVIPSGYAFESIEAENKTKGDGIRNSYDQGDKNLNGKQDGTEVWTGRRFYTETWNGVFTMVHPGDENDTSAFIALENAINANLDPQLHITITPDKGENGKYNGNATITMANQARDPWKNEYHGVFITNSVRDHGADRGAIILYSDGPNGKWGSAHDITNGVVTVTVPGNNINGKDDYSFTSCYTFTNGYGEVQNMTTGFSNNKDFMSGNTSFSGNAGSEGGNSPGTPTQPNQSMAGGLYADKELTTLKMSWDDLLTNGLVSVNFGAVSGNTALDGFLVLPNTNEINSFNGDAFKGCNQLDGIVLRGNFSGIPQSAFTNCTSLSFVVIPDGVTEIFDLAFEQCTSLSEVQLPSTLTKIDSYAFAGCSALKHIDLSNVTSIGREAFYGCQLLTSPTFSNNLYELGQKAFEGCSSITSINIPSSVQSYERNNLTSMYNPQSMTQSTRTSSVSMTNTFSSIGLTLSTTMNLNQNMRDSTIALTLPDLNISLSRFYPFKRKKMVGKERWYEKISMSYTGHLSNSISTKEDNRF